MFRAFLASFLLFFANQEVEKPKNNLLLVSSLKGYFTFPISPGTTASLSGSFGDIRINHFHSGLDIRTGGREGKSVFSAAEGYVSRIMVSRGGYGNALYITHPNGYTTLYAHLKEYVPKIKKYLNQKQYEQKQWEVDVYLEPGEIPIKKAEMVAFSGNTGGSGGPHLHFEVRDTEENTLDPAEFDFFEIRDNVAPVIETLSVVCKSEDALVNGKFGVFDFPVKRLSNGQYSISQVLNIQGKVGFELYTYDKSQTSPFRLGIKSIVAQKNEIQTYKYTLDKLSFSNKIDMNMHTNYERMLNDSKKFHKAYYEVGNSLGLYEIDANNGLMTFVNGEKSNVKFEISDTFGNKSRLNFNVSSSESERYNPTVKTASVKLTSGFIELLAPQNSKISIKKGDQTTNIVYAAPLVFDLSEDLVRKIEVDGKELILPYTHFISPEKGLIDLPGLTASISKALYHGIPVKVENSPKLMLHEDIDPLKGRFEVHWSTPTPSNKERTSVYLEGKKPNYVGGEWTADGIFFKPKEFGTFVILEDKQEPVISPRIVNSQNLQFSIKDDLSGIKSIECHVNGEWVMMEYEYKNGMIWSEKLDDSKPFEGPVDLYITDNAGNKAHYSSKI
jgi:murein DD-endopeptidase MepM/ murein hydrolase activator NlpD